MAYTESLPAIFKCRCGHWHRLEDVKQVDYDNSVYTTWRAEYLAPCGTIYRTHGADPAYGITAKHLEDCFEEMYVNVAGLIDDDICPECISALIRTPQRHAWRWVSGSGADRHVRVGDPADNPPAVCGARETEYPPPPPRPEITCDDDEIELAYEI